MTVAKPQSQRSNSVLGPIESVSAPVNIKPPDTFIIVKFGDDEEVVFNTNCQMRFLLHNIKERCQVAERVIDLCDIEGNQLNVRDESIQTRYGVTVFRPRQLCVLIEIKKSDEDGKSLRYIPLLDNREIVNDNFLANLSPKNTAGRSKAGSKASIKYNSKPSKNDLTNSISGSVGDMSKSLARGRSQSIVPSATPDRKKSVGNVKRK